MAGGALRNTYHPQRGLPGLLAVGDAVTTTAPTAGRGVAMAFLQVDQVLRLLDSGADLATVAEPFGAWSDEQMLPWVVDHVTMDEAAALRWQGQDIDLTRPLPSDLVVTAAEVEPRLAGLTMPYVTMTALPATLAAVEPAGPGGLRDAAGARRTPRGRRATSSWRSSALPTAPPPDRSART